MIYTLSLIIYVWFILALFQVIAVPFLIPRLGKSLPDGGWALGRITIWLLLGLPIWMGAHYGLPVNSTICILGLLVFIVFLSFKSFQRHKFSIIRFTIIHWRLFLIEELLFAFGLFFLSWIRSFNPDILNLEKFMEAGFMAAYLRSPTLPLGDIWLAGETINYYSFGHFLGAVMTRLWNLEIADSYNLLLGLIMGLVLVQSFGLVAALVHGSCSRNKSLKPLLCGGFVGLLLVAFGGNTHTLWYGLKNISWEGFWYPDSTRFIKNTIHEFPSYSFVVSDLHAHVWGLPLVLLFLTITLVWYRAFWVTPGLRSISSRASVMGVVFGMMIMTNAWDGAIYTLVLLILVLSLAFFYPRRFPALMLSVFIIGILGLSISSSWWVHFKSMSGGIVKVKECSPIGQIFVLWTGHWIMSGLAVLVAASTLHQIFIKSIAKKQKHSILGLIIALAFTAWVLILLPEFIYVKDIYTSHPRANTMFKLTYQAFVLMSLIGGWLVGYLQCGNLYLDKVLRKGSKIIIICIVIGVTCAHLLFPYFAYRTNYGELKTHKGLDGLLWLKEKHPSDYDAIMWLRDSVKGSPVILEAVGDSYTTFARVSAFTGIPTVLGWRVHEWLWRGGFDIPGKRTEDVKKMFELPLSPEASQLFETYQVRYIFVGDKEREAYENLDPEQLKELGPVVFRKDNTFIIDRRP